MSNGFFETLEIPLIAGRGFEPSDGAEAPKVVIVNHTLAKIYFDGEDPVGRRVRFSKFEPADLTIVGVVADSVHEDLRREVKPFLYRPLAQAPAGAATVYVRAVGSPDVLTRLLPAELAAVDPNLPMTEVRTMAESLSRTMRAERRLTGLLAAFGFIGLAIAALGLYGVLSYAVVRRTREVGVRRALGAQATDIAGMVARRGLVWVGTGALAGVGLAYAAHGLIEAALFGLEPTDLRAYAGSVALLLASAGFAAAAPALRASRIEPAEALRHE